MTTRGIRNRNPGNIDRNDTKWQGMAADQSGDARFVVFKTPEWGIRALAKTLMTYEHVHKLDTVRKIVNRWAPPSENNTSAYVKAVAAKVGVLPDDVIDVDSMDVMRPLVAAIIAHENAGYAYAESVIDEGLRLAGVHDAKPKPLAKQTTFIAQAATGASVVGAACAQYAAPVKDAADKLADYTGAPVISHAVTALLTIAGLCTLAGIVSAMLKQRAAT